MNALSGSAPFETLPVWSLKRLTIILGQLQTDGQPGFPKDRVQVLVNLADRAFAALPGDVETELHLPYIDRRNWAERFDILDQTTFVEYAGRVVPASLVILRAHGRI